MVQLWNGVVVINAEKHAHTIFACKCDQQSMKMNSSGLCCKDNLPCGTMNFSGLCKETISISNIMHAIFYHRNE